MTVKAVLSITSEGAEKVSGRAGVLSRTGEKKTDHVSLKSLGLVPDEPMIIIVSGVDQPFKPAKLRTTHTAVFMRDIVQLWQ